MSIASSERLPTRKITVVIIGYLAFIVMAMPETALGVAWPSMQATFGIPLDALGVLLITSRIGLIIASFNSGRLTTFLGIGLLLLIGSGLRTAALFGYAIAPTWGFMLAISILAGAGGGLVTSGLNTYFAMNHGARLMNWLHASFGLGAMLGPILMTAILNSGNSWRLGYAITAVLQVLVAFALLATLSDWKLVPKKAAVSSQDSGFKNEAVTTEQRPNTTRLWRSSILWLSMGLFFVSAGIESTTGQWSFSLLTESRMVPIAVAGAWVSVYWGSFTAGRILFGFVADRWSERWVIRIGTLLAGFASLLLWADLDPWSGLVSLALMGLALAPISPLLTTSTPDRLGNRDAPAGVGYQVGAASIGIAIMPGLAGFLAQRSSLEIVPPFLIASCLAFLLLYEITLLKLRSRVI
jgi:fucose permease